MPKLDVKFYRRMRDLYLSQSLSMVDNGPGTHTTLDVMAGPSLRMTTSYLFLGMIVQTGQRYTTLLIAKIRTASYEAKQARMLHKMGYMSRHTWYTQTKYCMALALARKLPDGKRLRETVYHGKIQIVRC